MSPDDPGLSRLRVEVFAVLLPYNEPISAYKFRKEFEDAMGSECDFKKFGFASMDRFLQAHPKVQAVSGADGQMLYKAKMDESTAQLQKFVQKQKKKKKGKGGKKSGRGRGGYAWQWQTSRQVNIQTIPSARDSRYTNSYRQQQHNRSTTLPVTSQSFRRGSSLHPPQTASFAVTRRPFFARLNPTSPSPSAGPSYGVPAAQFSAFRPRSSSHFSTPSADRRPVAQPQAQQPVAATPVQFDLNMSRHRILQTMLHCSGSATIARFLSAYKQLYSRSFDGDECIRLFGTRKLRRIIHDHFSDEILVTKMDDEILLVSKKVASQATEWAVANSRNGHTVYEPSKVHCKLPNLQVACDNIVQMLIDSFPRHIPISELSQAYENAYGILLDPTAVFGKSWALLVSGLFKAKLTLSLDKESVGLQEKLVQELQLEKKLRNKQKQMTETSKSLSANEEVELDLSEEDEDEEESDDEEDQSEDDKDEEERRGRMKGDANALDELRKLTLRNESDNKFDESSSFSTDQESRLSPIRPPFPTSSLHSPPSHPRQSAVPFPLTFPAAILTSKFNLTPSTQSIMVCLFSFDLFK
ncbi:hypothetical protein WR25_15499 isoform A [Diploscapter pachys]|uniref:HTH OST-type domain-containing protein n=2 Tax=Diploscapter pachys TaxID=2018661 RepID=A0A2A2J492_9BILA|nr:hypothetical protein WR25_15499 isoform A [Diploscapter pachys]